MTMTAGSGWHKDDIPAMREAFAFLRTRFEAPGNVDCPKLRDAYDQVLTDLYLCLAHEKRMFPKESQTH
jgi:hypothetical protein